MKTSLALMVLTLLCAATVCAQRRMSDREADGLKGKVQKVSTEEAQITIEAGKQVEGKRVQKSIVTYDADGNVLRHEVYNDRGNLLEVHHYSVIDGDRVMKVEKISDDDGYGRGSVSTGGKGETKPRDARYNYKFKYKYDAKGNRLEEAWYLNNGALHQRVTSVYDEKGNESENSRITREGIVFVRFVRTYDDKGNVIEETMYLTGRPTGSKWSYSYELDANGNWTKQTRMKWITKDGKSFFEPQEIVYRTITYF